MPKYSRFRYSSIILLFALLLLPDCTKSMMSEKEAGMVLQEYCNDQVPGTICREQIIQAGKTIVPYLLKAIQDRDMPRRVYAFLALSELKDQRALPVLQKICDDPSEDTVIRQSSLQAIWNTDKTTGEKVAMRHTGESISMDEVIYFLRLQI